MRSAPTRSVRAVLTLTALLLFTACGRVAAPPEEPRPMSTLLFPIVPAPVEMTSGSGGPFVVDQNTRLTVHPGDTAAARVADYLARLIGNTVETLPEIVETAAPGSGSIALRVDRRREHELGPEGYTLESDSTAVRIVAATPAGLFFGAQTLRQLLPALVEYTAAFYAPMQIAPVRIVDRPRFEWRGAMLDVSRHFLTVAEVERFIEHMALYKLNRLHLHLSDDQGWRIEIPGWPRLTEIGGSREVGGGEGGFYTQDDYRRIVEYAGERQIVVVPEIDMPGHTNAALASYPDLNCSGEAPALYTGTKVGFSALCVEKEITYRFIEDVVREISAITPGEYFHIGGDEVEKLTDEHYRLFIERVEGIVRAHGKRMIGWGEVAPARLSASTIVQHWKPDSAHLAVARGSKVILSPASKIYLDMKYDESTVLGLKWAGYNDLRDAYAWDPAGLLPDVPEAAILGIEAPLWSETLGTLSDFEYMAFPRLVAVAEIGWSPAARIDWQGFRQRLEAQEPRWVARGINYAREPLRR